MSIFIDKKPFSEFQI